ncbi:MAG: O-antigen ligase family protein [Actinobacteria bacterium]|nr:O-antigen ligase family protein [Actinomycetota bacterium]MBV8598813.1 O-antigen ligase family protein [Actinomycetota bacterium]
MATRIRAATVLPLVPAAAIPFLFLHRSYQGFAPHVGPAQVFSSDIAIAATVAAALIAGIRQGWDPLRRAPVLWAFAVALFVLVVASCFWRPLDHTQTHLVTAAKLIEYALLAPSVVLLLRRRLDVDRFLWVFVLWNVAAAAWGTLQFLGLVNEFEGKRPAQREVSFIGIHDFAGFSGATLAIGLAGIALGNRSRLVRVATASGIVGSILPASVFAYSGVVVAAILAAAVGRRAGTLTARRAGALVAILAVVGAGVYELRGSDVSNFLSFLGHSKPTASQSENIQTGAQHVLLAYIGVRIWLDHPILGVGLDRSSDDAHYEPYIAAAKRRFPHQAPSAFPSPQHRWGVQNLWIQALADTGVVGLALLLGTFAAAFVYAVRALRPAAFLALALIGWLAVATATWNALGIIAGNPMEALTWLGFGLAAAVGTLAA